jgi:hypothetical protein
MAGAGVEGSGSAVPFISGPGRLRMRGRPGQAEDEGTARAQWRVGRGSRGEP